MNLYLQTIVENFNINNLPADWLGVEFKKFSDTKSLFDYQQKALENGLKALYLYFEKFKENKSEFFQHYINNGLIKDLSYSIKEDSKIVKYLQEYDKNYIINNEKISFEYFINRMSFWMATGSGKTLVIVKLIEMLAYLMQNNKIPQKDILFLTYRDDLIEQFKKHIDEFNSSNNSIYINLIELKEYAAKKQNMTIKFGNSIDVYFYRSDLISNEQKEKILNYKNNIAKWQFIIWDVNKNVFYSTGGNGEPPPSFVWDGKGVNDEYVKTGEIYYYSLIAYDTVGNKAQSQPKAQVVLLKEIKLTFSSDALFDLGKADVKISAYNILRTMKKVLDEYPETNITVAGHTDNISPSGTKYKTNKELSKARADAVKFFMVNLLSVDEKRITTVGYGEDFPIATNETEEGRAKNRRVEIILKSTIYK